MIGRPPDRLYKNLEGAHRVACYRANREKLNSLEPSTAMINTEVQEIQLDQDKIDQLEGREDDTVIQRRNRVIDGVKLKLTKVNKDRAEGQCRTEQIPGRALKLPRRSEVIQPTNKLEYDFTR